MSRIRKIVVASVFAAVSLVSLTGCGNNDTPTGYADGGVITVDYNGKPLNCVTWNGSHGEEGRTCDFVEYHEKYGFTE